MSQHDFTIDNQGFPAFRSDLNLALQALASTNTGATEPSTTFAGQLWVDTANNVFKLRNEANTDWVTLPIDTTDGTVTGYLTSTDIANMLETTDIGVSVQAYDVDTLKADVADTLTAPFRGAVTTDNDLSFDMSAGNNFTCTVAATGTLTFTNITAGQSGNIFVANASAYAISAAATTLISSADLTKLSTAGSYWVSYYSADGTNVNVAVSPALTAAGA